MADLGIAVIIPIPNTLTGEEFRPNNGPTYAGTFFDTDPERNVINPDVGQIWPRGIVGKYTGTVNTGNPGTLGIAILHNLVQFIPRVAHTLGQLWSRGDYIPNP